jgi:hypothetical protein
MTLNTLTTDDLASALRDMMSLTDEIERGVDGEMIAIDVHQDMSNLYVIAGTGEQFRVSVVRIA